MNCPLCGGYIARVEVTTCSGERAYSLCCGIPQEFIDHYEMFANLPGDLFSVAVEARKAEYAAMDEADHEIARRFRIRRDEWDRNEGAEMRREYNADQGT